MTYSYAADGIAAYSLGGGGSGGFGLFYSGGGNGSTGGNGGNVIVDANSTITTNGGCIPNPSPPPASLCGNAHGILAQSIGGGGGSAGNVAGLAALGGSGAGGGSGGTVIVTNTGAITTYGVSSNAIEAQSIGGGGGNGANSTGGFSEGGNGSGTTTGGAVSVANEGVLQTYSAQSVGILAQSIGGGGGNGGSSGGLFSYGGSGGSGADGNAVTVSNGANITTGLNTLLNPGLYPPSATAGASGIVAQSIGGGGGNGGGSVAVGPDAAAFGGSGGVGGNGGSVSVLRDNCSLTLMTCAGTNAALASAYTITTYGDASSAIVAQSIGGGGGNGGFAIAASGASDFSAAIGIAGNGGNGGSGGTVEVDTKGSLTTYGLSSDGILAQSIGGGGGNGGFSVAASASLGASASVSLGGNGGSGNFAAAVTVSSLSNITTFGASSYGISAQSIGGGGGNGGFAASASAGLVGSISASVGGQGGSGGAGSTVNVTSVGNVSTFGANSVGIAAQSIGGGGGNGGFAVAGAAGGNAIGISAGGAGGSGGTADIASVDSTGAIQTTGDNSTGILAQSIGGGGGNGGFSASASIALTAAGSVSLGGSGGSGSSAGAASVYADGGGQSLTVPSYGSGWTLVTMGNGSAGIEAQSLGGSGGNGGLAGSLSLSGDASVGLSLGGDGGNGGTAGNALVESGYNRPNPNNIITLGNNSSGIVVESIGGGGGNGGLSASLSGSTGAAGMAATFGGSGGNGGIAGSAQAFSVGNITTIGNLSDGVLAESIGGGGGNGGMALSAAGSGYASLGLSFGGSGGAGATAGAVTVNSTGNIATMGDQSNGIFAESLGGSGGTGGIAVSGTLTAESSAANVSLAVGGAGGSGSSSGLVQVTSIGNINTSGMNSDGILSQSISGSGGNGGISGALNLTNGGAAFTSSVGGNGGSSNGTAGGVIVNSTGNITTGNTNSAGIFAQSVGGGGGNGGFSLTLAASYGGTAGSPVPAPKTVGGNGGGGGAGGTVSVTSSGTVYTSGALSDGIFAQSVGGSGGNGGFSVGADLSYKGGTDVNSVGGSGGNGNTAAQVSAIANATAGSSVPGYSVVTQGDNSVGILAQSIGGGGGTGGFSVAGSFNAQGGDSNANSVGGSGGTGGNSLNVGTAGNAGYVPAVSVTDTGSIYTAGRNSSAIEAQSVGGGGGDGGFSIGVSGTAKDDSTSKLQTVGGNGGAAGNGADVVVMANATANSTASIATQGDLSYGILAQSVGGGGGNGGFAIAGSLSTGGGAAANATGGNGNGGGAAGNVTVTMGGSITTGSANVLGNVFQSTISGEGSTGILAQSIGGGGGSGGFSGGLALGIGGDAATNTTGGSGGVGGSGANVDVTTLAGAAITTFGDNASGILAQSVGGGGGSGGFSIGAAFNNSNGNSAVNTVGGQGGVGGIGGDVIVTNAAAITTFGYLSNGIVAQSIGGGGGSGGFAVAGALSLGGNAAANTTGGGGSGQNAGTVMVTNSGAIAVNQMGTVGILAQSIGGGGGDGGFAGGLTFSNTGNATTNSIGGQGAGGGDGNTVGVTNSAAISATGDQTVGIFAQSVGGGGGNGGFAIGASASNQANATTQSTGGNGGAAGNGEAVTVTNNVGGVITTDGALSFGIIAQSVGGGGGNGGFSVGGSLSLNGTATSTVGAGSGGAGGISGIVTVENFANIIVQGLGSTGIFAQSVGGGGGNGGFASGLAFSNAGAAANNTVGGQGAGGGNGNNVNVTNSAAITATGDQGVGIFAQSVGGGGGNGGFAIGAGASNQAAATNQTVGGNGGAAGNGEAVTVTNNVGGAITTNGAMAYGIIAQSVGGGGGNGGFSFGGSLSLNGNATSTVGAGSGGAGGSAGTVMVDNFDKIVTQGLGSTGILAQSVGGGGGSGGFAGGLSFSSGGEVSNTVGGGGGGAGNTPSSVTVTNETGASVTTMQANSIGILAQAIAGGGGSGGFSISGAASTGGNGLAQSVGGQGGTGGSIPSTVVVTVNNNGSITTNGALSYGIYAQSVGGGNGGISVAGAYSSSGGATSSVGGGGASGGAGGQVVVNNTGSITVNGVGSVGVFAQSVGGGGGASGFSGALNLTGGGMLTNTVGGAGSGGDGGNVTVTSTGTITTAANDSVSVIAQSIGGGGGNGAFSISAQNGSADGADLQVGGSSGGPSGTMGTVVVNISGGMLQTSGDLSYGLLAQGVGGGGGNGAMSVPDPLTVGAVGVIQTVGASGATGDGLAVTTTNANSMVMTGAGSLGLISQSIGGGGGTSGVTGDVTFTAAGPMTLTAGGSSAGGGSGNTNSVTNTAAGIQTSGDAAAGLLAQSIGGGGGSAIYALGVVTGQASMVGETLGGSEGGTDNGGTLTLSTSGIILTTGRFAPGIVAQTIGGGGYGAVVAPSGISVGAAGVQFMLGATGGAGGAADPTLASTWTINPGQIYTTGKLSDGIVAQAIGAGGGLAGFVSDGAQAPPLANVTFGASGGAAGNGSTVTLTNQSSVTTSGIGAVGLIGQSIGGGGGVVQAYGVSGAGPVTFGASGGASGNGGTVALNSEAGIATTGTDAHGIVAQSIGGGGGFFLGFDTSGNPVVANIVAGTGGAGGSGGAVGVIISQPVSTTGAGAYGVIAQSIGGGGGLVGGGTFALSLPAMGSFAGTVGGSGSGGTVNVTASANIAVTGQNSTAIFAQSVGGSGGNAISVNVATGATVSGGAGAGNAVALNGGLNNLIANAGTLTTVSGINGTTITAGAASNAVVNTNLVIGSVDLCLNGGCGAVNSFDNRATGIFDSGATVNLGPASVAGNLLSNEGLISPGAFSTVFTTNVTGNFTQSSTGIYGLDLDLLSQTTDRINITGTAAVSGAVLVNILNSGSALPGAATMTILSAAGGETNPGLMLTAVETAVAQYGLTFPNSGDIDLQYSINFSPGGLTTNQQSVGNAVNQIQSGRLSPNFVPIASALFYQPTVAALGQAYDSLSGEGVSGVEQTTFTANDLFMGTISNQTQFWLSNKSQGQNSVMYYADEPLSFAASNPQNPASTAISAAAHRQPLWRLWGQAYGETASVNGENPLGTAQLSYGGGGLAVGADYVAKPDTLIGVAFGGNFSAFDVPDRATSGTVDGGQFALYAAQRWGGLYATGIAGFDFYQNSEKRLVLVPGSSMTLVSIPNIAENLTGNFGSESFNTRFEAGWRAAIQDINITPFAALEYSALNLSGFSEQGNGAPPLAGLDFASRWVSSLPLSLGAQVDSSAFTSSAHPLTYWARLAWVHEFEPSRTISASFLAAPGYDFLINGAIAPNNAAQVDVGLNLGLTKSVSFLTNFTGDFSGVGNSYAGSLGIQVAW